LEKQPWGGRADEVVATATAPSTVDDVLVPGDALYLPRGWLHRAEAVGELSLHLTVGVKTITRYALVETLLDLAAQNPALRASLPFGVEVADPDDIAQPLAATVTALREWLDQVSAHDVADRLRQRYWRASRPAPIRPLAQAAAVASLNMDTVLTPRPGLRWQLRRAPDDRVALVTFDGTLSFPASCEPALRYLLEGPPRPVTDLPGLEHPDDRLMLARRLLREGIVVTA
jgi:bifunctional lysine-specific demethylase and histidyl-hydroxylase NO66